MEKNNMHGGIGTYDRAAACHVTGGNVEIEQYRLVVAGSYWKLAGEAVEIHSRNLVCR